jgi:hypothetical protein
MIEFPNTVYKEVGPHWHPRLRLKYRYKAVADEEQYKQALADGWRLSLVEAVIEPEAVVESEEPIDDSPPTKEEMLQKAEELGLKIDKRWSEKTLLAKIEEAL